MPNQKFEKGDQVFRRGNPGKKGVVSGAPVERANRLRYPVNFDGRIEHVLEGDLKKVPTSVDWVKELADGNFGRASDVRRSFSHVLIGGNLSSLIYSMDMTGTEFMPHQFKPVLTFLDSSARGLLIADEVGLGKTIEAGLIWTELRARDDYRRILVVCPAVLREKWKIELRKRFGVDAVIMNAAELLDALQKSRRQDFDARGIICSMSGIRLPSDAKADERPTSARSKLKNFLEEQAEINDYDNRILDLVVVDEAHHMRNPESQSARLGRKLRDVSKRILLLSATPINLKSEDLFQLLNIVDEDTFSDKDFFARMLRANEPILEAKKLLSEGDTDAQKLRELLQQASRSRLIHKPRLQNLMEEVTQGVDTTEKRAALLNKLDGINLLRDVVNRTRKSEVLQDNKVVRKPIAHFVEMNSVERNFYDSVSDVINKYANEHGISKGFLLDSPQRQISSCLYAAAKRWSEKAASQSIGLEEEERWDIEDQNDAEYIHEITPLIDYLCRNVMPSNFLTTLRDNDSKFSKFWEIVNAHIRDHQDEKILVFSTFRATLEYLHERLEEHGVNCRILMGGMDKQEVIDNFENDASKKVLLSSEVASEGVDLQFCRVLINYDMPWNPMRIEQRIGRLDRIGQKASTISILNFGHKQTVDATIYTRLYERLNIFERALGEMEGVLGEEINDLTHKFLRDQMTQEEYEKQVDNTAKAKEQTRKLSEKMEREASKFLVNNDYILEKVNTVRSLEKRITKKDLKIYVRDYLTHYATGHEFQELSANKFKIKLPAENAAKFDAFLRKQNLLGETMLLDSRRSVEYEFKNKVAPNKSSRIEIINQFHPLIRFIRTQIKDAEIFPLIAAKLSAEALRESSMQLDIPTGQYAFAVHEWRFDGLRKESDIRVRATHLEKAYPLDLEDSWKLLNAVRLGGKDWPEARSGANRGELESKIFECYDFLEQEFQSAADEKAKDNQERVDWQKSALERSRQRQMDSYEKRALTLEEKGDPKNMARVARKGIENIKIRLPEELERLDEKKSNVGAARVEICCGILLLQ